MNPSRSQSSSALASASFIRGHLGSCCADGIVRYSQCLRASRRNNVSVGTDTSAMHVDETNHAWRSEMHLNRSGVIKSADMHLQREQVSSQSQVFYSQKPRAELSWKLGLWSRSWTLLESAHQASQASSVASTTSDSASASVGNGSVVTTVYGSFQSPVQKTDGRRLRAASRERDGRCGVPCPSKRTHRSLRSRSSTIPLTW